MHKVNQKCVGVTYTVDVPETVEEFDQLGNKQGLCLAQGIKNILYRGVNPQFRSAFCEAVEEKTGIERKTEVSATKTVVDEDGNETTEDVVTYVGTEKDYLDGVYAELGLDTEEARQAYFKDEIAAVEESLKFDPSMRERAERKTKAKKMYREAAETIDDNGKLASAAEKLSAELGYDVEQTTDSVALALQVRDERRAAALLDEF